MSREILTLEDAQNAIYGGCILGGGGGGWIEEGLQSIKKAFELGNPELISIDEFNDDEYAVCVSLVGAPSAEEAYVDEEQLTETVVTMQNKFSQPIKALMTNENGASTTVNGWIQAATTGLPLLDAPSNGRAHPTGSMGSMNLSEVAGYESIQAFAGGEGDKQLKGSITSSLDVSSSAVRSLSVQAGGMVGVCRNPIHIGYVKENAAIGGITQSIALGKAFFSAPEGPERIEAVVSYLKGDIIYSGKVSHSKLNKSGGFDVGTVVIDDLELTFWNEFMTVEMHGDRKGTFPDLIMTFNAETGKPLVSAEIREGINIVIIVVPQKNITLGSTMFNKTLLKSVEPIIQKTIL